MKRSALAILIYLFSVTSVASQTQVTAMWDSNTDGRTTGYIVRYGLAPGNYTNSIVVPGVNTTSVVITGLSPNTKYYFNILAYDSSDIQGPLDTEVFATTPNINDPKCLSGGQFAVVIFPTRLVKTGSGNAGSLSEIYFVVSSPNSPITYLSIRGNGVDIPDSIMGPVIPPASLKPTLGSRFSVPSTPVNYSIYGINAYGCTKEQPTIFHN